MQSVIRHQIPASLNAIFVGGVFIALLLVSSASGQSGPCTRIGTHAEYKIVQSYKTDIPPYLVRSLRIVVKRKHFNREDMTTIAKQIQQEFCNDPDITGLIFDSEKIANTMDEGMFLQGKIIAPHVRGLYSLTGGSGGSIEFSTQRSKPLDEVKVTHITVRGTA